MSISSLYCVTKHKRGGDDDNTTTTTPYTFHTNILVYNSRTECAERSRSVGNANLCFSSLGIYCRR
uniref:Uncharacterized protein n=1 Tax=Malacosoma sp. alphabaculovirus TaxID=1881632 RepID=A0A1B1V5L1_9ABAC|nr:hypothetical protein [Malacosoma sp. alphabaculovirus]